jgi:hypothetical protein
MLGVRIACWNGWPGAPGTSPSHIVSDNRLSWLLGRLHDRCGDKEFYVHLIHDREAPAKSFDVRWHWRHSIIRAYAQGMFCSEARSHEACSDSRETVNANIRVFIAGHPRATTVRPEHAAAHFTRSWDDIGAEANKEEVLRQWDIQHNAVSKAKSPQGASAQGALDYEKTVLVSTRKLDRR